jgi:hypothetical protein
MQITRMAMKASKYNEYLKDGKYISPFNGKLFESARAFSAHLRNMGNPNSAPKVGKVCCIFCQSELTVSNIKSHSDNCYLNPTNKRLCEVCDSPIKNFRTSQTCSYACSNTKFRSGPDNPNWKDDKYTTTCFHYHEKKCVICAEQLIVEVHHLDENHENNVPSNLIPLCPTHHQYWHSRYKNMVEPQVLAYLQAWKQKNPGIE